jgi:hypothetical protein
MHKQTYPAIAKQTTLLRLAWLLPAILVLGMAGAAAPPRYRMLQADVYGYGAGLLGLGLSLSFFAAYFTIWELIVAGRPLLVAAFIAWKRADDLFAMLVAVGLTLFGLLPPLVDGLSYAYPIWTLPIALLRMVTFSCLLAVFCLFPNGRFIPKWTAWLFLLWPLFAVIILITNPLIIADTAIIPNTRTLKDAIWVLYGTAWFAAAAVGQIVRGSLPVLHIDVTDDGSGLPPKIRPGVGMASMRDRAEELGGVLAIDRAEAGGAHISARLPFADAGLTPNG